MSLNITSFSMSYLPQHFKKIKINKTLYAASFKVCRFSSFSLYVFISWAWSLWSFFITSKAFVYLQNKCKIDVILVTNPIKQNFIIPIQIHQKLLRTLCCKHPATTKNGLLRARGLNETSHFVTIPLAKIII